MFEKGNVYNSLLFNKIVKANNKQNVFDLISKEIPSNFEIAGVMVIEIEK